MIYDFVGNELNDVLKKIIEQAEAGNIKVIKFDESDYKNAYAFTFKNKPKYELGINRFLMDYNGRKTWINLYLALPNNDEVQSREYYFYDESETGALFRKAFVLIKEINKKTNKKFLYEFLK